MDTPEVRAGTAYWAGSMVLQKTEAVMSLVADWKAYAWAFELVKDRLQNG